MCSCICDLLLPNAFMLAKLTGPVVRSLQNSIGKETLFLESEVIRLAGNPKLIWLM